MQRSGNRVTHPTGCLRCHTVSSRPQSNCPGKKRSVAKAAGAVNMQTVGLPIGSPAGAVGICRVRGQKTLAIAAGAVNSSVTDLSAPTSQLWGAEASIQ